MVTILLALESACPSHPHLYRVRCGALTGSLHAWPCCCTPRPAVACRHAALRQSSMAGAFALRWLYLAGLANVMLPALGAPPFMCAGHRHFWHRNSSFGILPGSGQPLRGDVWQGALSSGLLHGGVRLPNMAAQARRSLQLCPRAERMPQQLPAHRCAGMLPPATPTRRPHTSLLTPPHPCRRSCPSSRSPGARCPSASAGRVQWPPAKSCWPWRPSLQAAESTQSCPSLQATERMQLHLRLRTRRAWLQRSSSCNCLLRVVAAAPAVPSSFPCTPVWDFMYLSMLHVIHPK